MRRWLVMFFIWKRLKASRRKSSMSFLLLLLDFCRYSCSATCATTLTSDVSRIRRWWRLALLSNAQTLAKPQTVHHQLWAVPSTRLEKGQVHRILERRKGSSNHRRVKPSFGTIFVQVRAGKQVGRYRSSVSNIFMN
jgi:hypothetical protein